MALVQLALWAGAYLMIQIKCSTDRVTRNLSPSRTKSEEA